MVHKLHGVVYIGDGVNSVKNHVIIKDRDKMKKITYKTIFWTELKKSKYYNVLSDFDDELNGALDKSIEFIISGL